MGFVATTLSICDPVGTILRLITKFTPWEFHGPSNLEWIRVFGKNLTSYFRLPYFLATIYSPEDIKKTSYKIDKYSVQDTDRAEDEKPNVDRFYFEKIRNFDPIDFYKISILFGGLKEQSVKTKWITAEIDRITALVYFMIVISVFIVATLLYPVFSKSSHKFFRITTQLGWEY
jgi:hypothetical protein